MRFQRLADWLEWQETLNPKHVDLGLERPRQVAREMRLESLAAPVVSVAGTNGKGSVVAYVEAIAAAAGCRVAAYYSPYLLRYNESLRIGGEEVDDETLMAAFERVDRARGETKLTCFEFRTLAAFDIIRAAMPSLVALEVGLGGRLDAVNVVDADVAVITTVDVDHTDWLGSDRESIAREKAGIMRRARPAVLGDDEPAESIVDHARRIGAPLHVYGRDFRAELQSGGGWRWRGPRSVRDSLPRPSMSGAFQYRNAATALMALDALAAGPSIDDTAVAQGLTRAYLPARQQILSGAVERILDVAHNRQAARGLAETLAARPTDGRVLAVFAILADKDATGVAGELDALVDRWYLAGLPGQRGRPVSELADTLARHYPHWRTQAHADVAAAYANALKDARQGDRIVVFGSFLTVRQVLDLES